jgi:flagellar biosynthesis protein FlhB
MEIGDEIPEHLYKAVAEVLAFIYRLKGRKKGPASAGRAETSAGRAGTFM